MFATLSYRSIVWRTAVAAALLALLLLYTAAPARASVEITSFSATGNSSGVRINWSTASEIDHLGYNVFRTTVNAADFGDVPAAQRVQINPLLIASEGGTTGATYNVSDDTAEDGVTYYYWLEMIDIAGQRTYAGPAEARRGSSGSLIGGGTPATATPPPGATATTDVGATPPAAATTTTPAAQPTATVASADPTAVPLTAVPPTDTFATPTPTSASPQATPTQAAPTQAAAVTQAAVTQTAPTQAAPDGAQPAAPQPTALPAPATNGITQEAALAIEVAGENSVAPPAASGATPPDAAAGAEAPASNATAAPGSSDVPPTTAVAAAPIGGDSGQPSDVVRSGTPVQQESLAAIWLWIGLAVSAMVVVAGAGALLLWLRRQP